MFTGIIDNQGEIIRKNKRGPMTRLSFQCKRREKLRLGESIAVNGVCLTVAQIRGQRFEADLVPETLKATTLGALKVGDRVNLERSLQYGDRMSGHFVTGHIDGRGILDAVKRRGKNRVLILRMPEQILPYVAPKGSIAVDGISLTVQRVQGESFQVSIIPHTLKETTLGLRRKGDEVNLEIDLVARYMKMILEHQPSQARKLKLSRLIQQGF